MAGAISDRVLLYGRWLTVLLPWLVGSVLAQQRPVRFEFSHIREQDGLSFRVVNCLLHDRDGFLWVGTNNGLNRYDGSHFIQFRQQRNDINSLLNNQLYALGEDKKGRIWMGCENGVSYYDKTAGRFRHITHVNNQPLGICKNICCDRAGDVWFTSRNRGLFRYATRTGLVQFFPCYSADSKGEIRMMPNGLLEDPYRAGLWISARSGLRYFDIDRQQFTTFYNDPQHIPIFTPNWVSALALDGDQLLISDQIEQSILVYDLRQRRILKRLTPSTQRARDDFDVATIIVDRQHNLWVSSWEHRTFFIDGKTDHITELNYDQARPTGLGANSFMAGWQHPDGSVWLGTVNGIAYTNIERSLYDVYDLETLFPALTDERGIITFAEDPDGSWWLGTSIRGLLHYVPATNRLDVFRLPNRTAIYPWGMPVTGLDQRGDELFVGAENAVYRFNKRTHQFRALTLPPLAQSLYLRTYRLQGDRYWAFGDGKLTFAYSLTSHQWQTYPIQSVSKDPLFLVRQTLLDRQGDLWLDVYPEGFARFLPNQGRFIMTDTRQADYENTIYSLVEDRDGSFLIGTKLYGLLSYDPVSRRDFIRPENKFMTFSQCSAARPDRFGNTWVANLNMASVITPQKQVINIRLPINEYTTEYDTYLFPLKNGHILSAQKGDLVEFRPENLLASRTPEPVLLNRLLLSDTTLLLHGQTTPVQLKAEDNSFTVEFSSLSSATTGHYLYKLEGYDEGWKEVSTPANAVYTKLPGGDYVFKLKARSPEGIETPARSLAIHIDTPIYQTRWFQVLMGLVGIGLLILFFRYRTRQTARIYHLQMQATRLEHDKTQIQYQNLINHLNPHFLFNSLTSLNSLILTKPKDASVFLKKLSVIYRYILQNKDSELVSLQDELTFTQHYMDLQAARFGENLRISLAISPLYLTRRIVPVTIQNLLENAIKHNIVDDDNPLHIRIYTETDTLYVTNTMQKKQFVETSNKQGLTSLKSLYRYLSRREVSVTETATLFIVAVPLL